MNMVDTIVRAWKAGYTLFHPVIGKVLMVKKYTPQTPGPATLRGTLSATIGPEGPDQETIPGIEWLAPGRPSVGARFVLLRDKNVDNRRFGFGFSKYDEIKTIIGQATEVEINDQRAVIRSGAMELSLEFAAGIATVRNGANELQATSAGWTVTGPVTFQGEATFMKKVTASDEITAAKKITSSEDVMAGSISLKTHTHPYTDTPVGPSTTGPAQ